LKASPEGRRKMRRHRLKWWEVVENDLGEPEVEK
jgi:hypothetical protein